MFDVAAIQYTSFGLMVEESADCLRLLAFSSEVTNAWLRRHLSVPDVIGAYTKVPPYVVSVLSLYSLMLVRLQATGTASMQSPECLSLLVGNWKLNVYQPK